ncbi:MAG: sigma-70 family RNA polymerase sigma factor [Bacteroidales bacterium]|jgi:RNA polymerase sigma-70 factor (ECF subfamily)|nr:sigma-70 family RNA polymerase sigma factor [Bacteroidales bacterium]
MLSDLEIIEGCRRHSRQAQQILYDRYSRFLLGICLRYSTDRAEAEDILQDVFVRVFFNIDEYRGAGSFAGWLRKVAVNTAITHYHKNLKHRYHVDIDEYRSTETGTVSFEEDFFSADELYKVLSELPPGYKMVFNLYAIEGYKHREIAEIMNIDVNTSKSQYSRARAMLRDKLCRLREIKDYKGQKDIPGEGKDDKRETED